MSENKVFNFVSDSFILEEAIVKGEKKYFVEGFASTIDEDLQGEIVTSEAQDDMLSQLEGREITLDLEHEEWYDDKGNQLPRPKNQLIPVAKIIKAERRTSPRNGVWIKAEINSNLGGKFQSVWGSIKDGFLKAFSIAFYPVEAVSKSINGKLKTFISKLNLVNITLTGSPVNPQATFIPVMKASLLSFQNKSEGKMEEKINSPQEEVKEVPAEPVKEIVTPQVSAVEPVTSSGVVMMPAIMNDSMQMPLDMIKAFKTDMEILKSGLEKAEATIKSQSETISQLKAELEKPIFKATAKKEEPILKQVVTNPLDYVI